ncbi:MAG: V-type ATP synthase subunit F [Candidatus Hadarchaeota archaeon]
MSFEIAVIGELETVLGMSLAGVSHSHVHSTVEGSLSKLDEFMNKSEIGLILVTHRAADEMGYSFRQIMRKKGPLPVILRIPDKTGQMPKFDELSEMIKRTVGAEIVVKKEG